MTSSWREAAFAAYAAGDCDGARAALLSGELALLGDSAAMQLLAVCLPVPCDELALLHFAAAEIEGGDAGAWFNLAVAEQGAGLLARAQLHYEQALRLEPDHPGALNNLSDLLRRRGRSAEAWACIERYLAAGHDPAGLEIRIAKIADDTGQGDTAAEWFARAAAADPGDACRWEWAMQQLRDEDFAAGFAGYEARRRIYGHEALGLVDYSMPEWQGEPLAGKALLVHKEQGLGDVLMFAGCLADLPGTLGALHIAVQPPLVRLFAQSFPEAQVWPSTSSAASTDERGQRWRGAAGAIDLHCPFGSLARHTGCPEPRTYLRADETDRAVWRARLGRLAGGDAPALRAGLVISARPDGLAGAGIAEGPPKCLPPQLAHALAVPGIAWFGLHDRATAEDLAAVPGLGVIDTSDWLHDMADTAALVAELDLVVAVDTAVAHLAGALGKPVLLMLRHQADWRWGRTRTSARWYPQCTLFRQQVEGDWAPVVAAVAAQLHERLDRARTGA